MGVMLVFASMVSAALTNISGQVTRFEPGKSISVKDRATGGVQTLTLSKDTAVQGDVKVGAHVSIQADGNAAQSVVAMAPAPGTNPDSPSPPGTAEPDPLGGGSAGSPVPGAKAPGGSTSGMDTR
jgi:hypothetical protein